MIYLHFALGFLFAFLYLVETLGYVIREFGKVFGVTALAYSLHTQFGTVARMSTLIAMPAIGYLLDAGITPKRILLIPLTTTVLFTIVMLLVLGNLQKFLIQGEIFFRWYVEKVYGVKTIRKHTENDGTLPNIRERSTLAIASFISFFIVVSGVFSAIILASAFHDRRAMIMQSSVVFTSLGTFVSIFLFDPRISNLIDSGGDFKSLLKDIFVSRILAMFTGGLFLLILVELL